MKLMFNPSTVGVYTAVVSATAIPMVHVHAGLIQDVRRELRPLSEECKNITKAQKLEDPVYNETVKANTFACPDSQQGWLNADAVVNQVRDWRNCNQSEFRAYCQANYQVIDLPDHNLKCPRQEDPPYPYDNYYYDDFDCVARDPSCPSDSDVLTEQDVLSFYTATTRLINCTVEFLEEGHQPPPKPEAIESDNLSEECLDEIAMMFADAEFRNASNTFNEVTSEIETCKLAVGPYSVGNDTFTVINYSACVEQSDYNDFFDAISYIQLIDFTNRKIICPGNNFFYMYSYWDAAGKSCPPDQGDYTGNDMQSIMQGFENCVIETLEEGDEPPSPPTDAPTPVPPTTEDSPTEAPVEAQSAAASEPLLTSIMDNDPIMHPLVDSKAAKVYAKAGKKSKGTKTASKSAKAFNGKASKGTKAYSKSTKALNGKGSKASH